MTDPADLYAAVRTDDPFSWPFWENALRRRLVIQRCAACGHHQFHPRPFCLACDGESLDWVESPGRGRVHSATTVHIPVTPDLPPPYQVALVELDEGPRFLGVVAGAACSIGDRVELAWRDRDGLPPTPGFRTVAGAAAGTAAGTRSA